MKRITFLLLAASAFLQANAQKLPNVQGISLRAPATVKVDGKPTEWGNKFKAYNTATDVFYTMANDDNNLYLVVLSDDPRIIDRLMGRGITLSIQKEIKKDDANKVSITYPVTNTTLYFGLQRKGDDNNTSAKALDSVMNRHNKMIEDSCKFIQVSGIPGIDNLVSVYNVNGIMASAKFNNKKVFTCEFSINLKYLKALQNNNSKFAYHIVVNGPKPMNFEPGPLVLVNGKPDEKASEGLRDFVAKRSVSTDFWGEYTLAK